ncbi:MAG: 5-formyltetrahydrofolate cyclo-ligase [Candidatus Margulisbacteria bacterium]|nr:5-formyltetrahydrofolate cyclo-ligase [Candidatus Margulisiibacteriota bacterium]
MDKKSLRELISNKRANLSQDEILRKSSEVHKHLFKVLKRVDYQTIMLYCSVKNEVDTGPLLQHYWQGGKTVLLPALQDREMIVVSCSSAEPLIPGPYGIRQPVCKANNRHNQPIDVIIIPCVACDKQKNRLGFGKGYYDRFLQDQSALKIGLCYDFQLFEKIPADKHDIRLDFVITDKEVIP